MEVMLRKSRSRDPANTNHNRTFMASKHYFKVHSVLLSVQLISLNKKHGLKCFRDLFEIKHAEFFY